MLNISFRELFADVNLSNKRIKLLVRGYFYKEAGAQQFGESGWFSTLQSRISAKNGKKNILLKETRLNKKFRFDSFRIYPAGDIYRGKIGREG